MRLGAQLQIFGPGLAEPQAPDGLQSDKLSADPATAQFRVLLPGVNECPCPLRLHLPQPVRPAQGEQPAVASERAEFPQQAPAKGAPALPGRESASRGQLFTPVGPLVVRGGLSAAAENDDGHESDGARDEAGGDPGTGYFSESQSARESAIAISSDQESESSGDHYDPHAAHTGTHLRGRATLRKHPLALRDEDDDESSVKRSRADRAEATTRCGHAQVHEPAPDTRAGPGPAPSPGPGPAPPQHTPGATGQESRPRIRRKSVRPRRKRCPAGASLEHGGSQECQANLNDPHAQEPDDLLPVSLTSTSFATTVLPEKWNSPLTLRSRKGGVHRAVPEFGVDRGRLFGGTNRCCMCSRYHVPRSVR